jgi:hypothetical protein
LSSVSLLTRQSVRSPVWWNIIASSVGLARHEVQATVDRQFSITTKEWKIFDAEGPSKSY